MATGKKRRRRNPIPWVPFLWAAVVLDVVAGLLWSRLTALSVVRVVGAPADDEAMIRRTFESVANVPWSRVQGRSIEADVQAGEGVDRAEYSQNLFGRAVLRIEERRPVARIADSKLLLGIDGAVFRGSSAGAFPTIILPESALTLNGTLVGPWESGPVANLCRDLRERFPKSAWIVEVGPTGVISLRMDRKGRIVLGSSDALESKLEKLTEILRDRPDLPMRVRQIDLTAPESPVVVPLTNPQNR